MKGKEKNNNKGKTYGNKKIGKKGAVFPRQGEPSSSQKQSVTSPVATIQNSNVTPEIRKKKSYRDSPRHSKE